VVDLRLQECTMEEMAERLGCSERTIRRILKRVQARLAQALAVSGV
jgi:DNA-directed RNA polymerase specialized sigma24 family protein